MIDYEQIPATYLKEVKVAIEGKELELIYEVKDQLGKKMVKYVALVDENIDFNSFNRAAKQKQVLEYLKLQQTPVLKSKLMDELQVTHAIMKALVDKKVMKEIEVEAYRDPYADVLHQSTKALQLNHDQQVAVMTVEQACNE